LPWRTWFTKVGLAAMSIEPTLFHLRQHRAARVVGACFFALAFTMAIAVAQEARPQEEPGFFEGIARFFERTFSGAGREVEKFGNEAGVAAKTTVSTARDAAGAVARIPAARVMSGHAKCQNAPNGAPDCVAAANTLCKAKGFESGKSLDMTTAEVCPPKVLLSGRNTAGECRDETFVSRALCQ
jgi:hypothetical protein